MFAGFMHLIKPRKFKQFTPPFLPLKGTNYIAGIVEFSLGLGLFFPQTVKEATMGVFILMLLFLPIHFWDLAKESPAIGSKKIAIIRIPLQFLLMYFAYLIYNHS
jgi:uncharacterized membrane protein